MSQPKENPKKYVLFSHYANNDVEDFEDYKNNNSVENLKGIISLIKHFRGLKELLTVPGYEGMLVLFYTPGYEMFLKRIANQESNYENDLELRFSKEVSEYVREKIDENGLSDRVRFITPWDLEIILGKVNQITAEIFQSYFIGIRPGIRYDAPKIVEAILRLRLIGNGVPVFRLDHDVLFRDNEDIGDLGLFKSVACALRAYRLRMEEPTVSTFLFSASYNTRALLFETNRKDKFEAWSRAFATRAYPAIIVNKDKIQEIWASTNDQAIEKMWDSYVEENLNESILEKYYGIKIKNNRLIADGINGLAKIGAHSLFSVISGALLCMSEGAILDLPPFSNFQINVIWIDDHLKYSLHRAMRHFTSGETLDLEKGLSDARLDDVMVTKARPKIGNLAFYVLARYLPSVLWGAIMDAWITLDPIIKCRLSSMENSDEQNNWRNALKNQSNAPLPKALLNAHNMGYFKRNNENDLRKDLEKLAIERIKEVHELWSNLKLSNKETFASLWIQGKVEEMNFNQRIFAKDKKEFWKGIKTTNKVAISDIQSLDDLQNPICNEIRNMIDDAINYVNWTLEWPKFVQIVRSIPHGDFMGDINWQK